MQLCFDFLFFLIRRSHDYMHYMCNKKYKVNSTVTILHGCPPLLFVVDALDECILEHELADLILSLTWALHDPDLPVIHVLLTSRLESHISKVFNFLKELGPGCSQVTWNPISLKPFRRKRCFIVASTSMMMKFIIDDEDNDPHDRLQLMLQLTSSLLPGTEAYMHLSIVAALADPLPISQISSLLGPGLGRDVQTMLIQLWSVMDIPTDSTHPVNIYHSSVHNYIFDPSNCSLPQHRMSSSLGCNEADSDC
ncbi:hypothetical protein DFJ58DRAFT_858612 [Suillus subalutaceus]|uniref:uncharacterized protein n=1 Tax=Suillus subalutaceus TaxID=48586 RepID=UPI001B8764FC|nr:uncharacterized protein DFJ58DRAFT_858612 [Suillus subalutaceus]KAG1839965.1 hypothetical protein DFJ58DRAFT_858612 [Suillus subalutaceus]